MIPFRKKNGKSVQFSKQPVQKVLGDFSNFDNLANIMWGLCTLFPHFFAHRKLRKKDLGIYCPKIMFSHKFAQNVKQILTFRQRNPINNFETLQRKAI